MFVSHRPSATIATIVSHAIDPYMCACVLPMSLMVIGSQYCDTITGGD